MGYPVKPKSRYPNPLAFSVEHVIPRAARPDLTFDIKMSWEIAEDIREKVEDALNHGATPEDAERVETLHAFAKRLAATA